MTEIYPTSTMTPDGIQFTGLSVGKVKVFECHLPYLLALSINNSFHPLQITSCWRVVCNVRSGGLMHAQKKRRSRCQAGGELDGDT